MISCSGGIGWHRVHLLIIVISAHLDSRTALDNDSTGYAPGANDDGSGVAAILELVRIMSTRKFSATIVFMAVSGEEHGLYGAKAMAAKAKKEKWLAWRK